MLQAVRGVDELGGWITSCQMLKSCQLKVCEEEGGQLLNPRKKRGSLKSNYRTGGVTWLKVSQARAVWILPKWTLKM